MAITIFLVVILAAGAWVLSPVVREGGWIRQVDLAVDPSELSRKRNNALCGLRDLAMDFEMGRIEEADYQLARAEYEAEASAAIRMLESLGLPGEEG